MPRDTKAGPKSLARSLLASGLFLEREALSQMRSAGFDAWGPYEYPLHSGTEGEVAFGSVDIMASLRKEIGEVQAEVVVFAECKYRNPDGQPRLYFLEAETALDEHSRASVLQLSEHRAESKLKRSGKLPPAASLLGPGILAYRQDNGLWTTDGNLLNHAVAQSIRPSIEHCVVDAFAWFDPPEKRIRLYLSGLCTTAEIWTLPATTDMASLEAAGDESAVAGLAVKRDIGQFVYRPPQYLSAAAQRVLAREANPKTEVYDPYDVANFASDVRAGLSLHLPKRVYVGKASAVATLAKQDAEVWLDTVRAILES